MWLEIVQSSPYFKNMWCYAHTHKEKRLQLVACNSTSAPVSLRCARYAFHTNVNMLHSL